MKNSRKCGSAQKQGQNSTFRIAAQNWFLTYPKCTMTKEKALKCLSKKKKLIAWIIAEEKHQDGTPHLHAYLKLDAKFNCKDQKFWDLKEWHGNYQAVKSASAVMKYCTKEENYLIEGVQLKRKATPWLDALTMAKEGDTSGAMKSLEDGGERSVRDRLLYSSALQRGLREIVPIQPHEAVRNLKEFEPLFKWDKNRTLLLIGETNLGKTTLAVSLLPLSVLTRHLDMLATADWSKHQGFIMDDMSISHLHDEAQIAILDTFFGTQIHVRYKVVNVPKSMPRIITSNREPHLVINVNNPAICRRVQCIRMIGPGEYEEIAL